MVVKNYVLVHTLSLFINFLIVFKEIDTLKMSLNKIESTTAGFCCEVFVLFQNHSECELFL